MHNQDMSLVLSTDAKPRLKWTAELHQRFIEAITQLGGAEKATPKALMRAMGIPGLTLYHLKSHLQKYRLGKNQHSETCNDNKQEDYRENQTGDAHLSRDISDETRNQINESLQIARALQMQMEVQSKLHEQIEVQRHLQLRIEAQGKYLQSVLKKVQETLAGYSSSFVGVELAKAELSHLVSMVDSGCPSSSISGLTQTVGSSLKDIEKTKTLIGPGCSMESSLTSSESSGRKEDLCIRNSVTLPLMGIQLGHDQPRNNGSYNQASGRKRSGSTISDGNCVEQPLSKRSPPHKENAENQFRRLGLLETFDLNCQYQNDFDSCPKAIDLNCKGIEQLGGHL